MKIAVFQEIFIGELEISSSIVSEGEAAIYKYIAEHDRALDKGNVIDTTYMIIEEEYP